MRGRLTLGTAIALATICIGGAASATPVGATDAPDVIGKLPNVSAPDIPDAPDAPNVIGKPPNVPDIPDVPDVSGVPDVTLGYGSVAYVNTYGAVEVMARPGVLNDISMNQVVGTSSYVVSDSRGVLAGPGCTQLGPYSAECVAVGSDDVYVDAGDGDDQFKGSFPTSFLTIYGGPGTDSITTHGPRTNIYGDSGASLPDDGNDVISAEGAGVIAGGGGADSIDVDSGAYVHGSDGREDSPDGPDEITAGTAEFVTGGQGDDHIQVGSFNNSPTMNFLAVSGGPGIDTLSVAHGPAWYNGDEGDDVVNDGPGSAVAIYGGPGADALNGGAGDDAMWGTDFRGGGDGDDVLSGGAGADWIEGDGGDDTLDGGPGQDSIWGDEGADVVHAVDGERDGTHCDVGYDHPGDTLFRDPRDVPAEPFGCDKITTEVPTIQIIGSPF